jgi:hypothetical protein
MLIGELMMRESELRLDSLRRASASGPGWRIGRVLHWGAWLNYLLSIIVLTAGITAGWRFAEVGFDLMMKNVSGEEVGKQVIRKIPAWILAYTGIKTW